MTTTSSSSQSHSHSHSRLPSLKMLKLWPSSPNATPKPLTASGSRDDEPNPFESAAVPRSMNGVQTASLIPPIPSSPLGPRSPVHHHHLLDQSKVETPRGGAPPIPGTATRGFAAALASPSVSFQAPSFELQMNGGSTTTTQTMAPSIPLKPPSLTRQQSNISSASSSSSSSPARGQLHVKLIQARGLNVHSAFSKPYVCVQFEGAEFISRDPINETEKEVKGVATARLNVAPLSRVSSSSALNALGAIDAKNRGRISTNNTPPSSYSSKQGANGVAAHGTLGGMTPHNPVWKHEVSFDLTSDRSIVSFDIYDRSREDHPFLGMIEVKPVLKHDHTVDQWYKLRPYENELVTGEMRIQITYEQFKTKKTLTPRDFEFLKLIGRGTFGRVFQVRKRDTRRIYAMKVLSKKEIVAKKEIAHTIGERKILQRSLECPFLVGLKFSFQTGTDLYLVTDFKSGGELFWHLQKETRFPEERARFYVAELVLALEHLHKYDIVYRDLKPENILLDATGHVALCDFGLSKPDLPADQLTTTFCGTTEYLAPEVLLDDHGYSKLVDFWSLGVLLFEMCCGWSPFYAEDTQEMYKKICFGKIRFPKGVIGEDGKQFVKGLLNRNPKHRLGAQRDAAELREHPFFATIDWNLLWHKQITPPFKPVVESDESTSNFDPEFTESDVHAAGLELLGEDDEHDEDDPSEMWLSQSMINSGMHTPNGPLGSDRTLVNSPSSGTQTPAAIVGSAPKPIALSKKDRPERPGPRTNGRRSPISSSVQENFRGFSYMGESVAGQASEFLSRNGDTNSDEGSGSGDGSEEHDLEWEYGRRRRRNGFDDF